MLAGKALFTSPPKNAAEVCLIYLSNPYPPSLDVTVRMREACCRGQHSSVVKYLSIDPHHAAFTPHAFPFFIFFLHRFDLT